MGIVASIIIPLKNQRDKWLYQCVMSALEQTVKCEIIIVTSKQTNESNQKLLYNLKAYNMNLRIEVEQKPSFANAINTGINKSTHDRIGLLLSDDWLEKDAVEKSLKFDTDIVCSGNRIYNNDIVFSEHRPSLQKYLNFQTMERRARYLQHFFVFKKSKLLEIGGADETIGILGVDDFDMIWTLLEHDATVAIIEEILYNYRDHLEERLTLNDPKILMQGLENILNKHKVFGKEREQIIQNHRAWFGTTIYKVINNV